MQLKRSGANRFHGWTTLFKKGAKVSWDEKGLQIVVDVSRVSDGRNSFDYRLELDLPELAQIIDVAARDAVEKSGENIGNALGGSVRALTRLSGVASGLAVTIPVSPASSKGAA